jgi:hypothetical protein
MHFPEQNNIGPVTHDDPPPPEIPGWIRRLYQYPLIGRCMRFLTWGLIFAGIYASSSVCPFCGQAGCPVGAASAGLVGGLFALIISKGKVIAARVTQAFSFIRTTAQSTGEGKP